MTSAEEPHVLAGLWTPRVARVTEIAVVGVLLALLVDGLLVRLPVLSAQTDLNPDMSRYIESARQASWFFFNNIEVEPLHVLFLRVGFWFSDDAEQVARVSSIVQTVLAAGCAYAMARRLVGLLPAVGALWLFATNPVVLFYGVSGMRVMLYTAVLCAFVLVLFDPALARRRTLVVVVVGALCLWTRVYAIVVMVPLAALYLWDRRAAGGLKREGKKLAIAAALIFVLYLPDALFRSKGMLSTNLNWFRELMVNHQGSHEFSKVVTPWQFFVEEIGIGTTIWQTTLNYLRFAFDYVPHLFRGYELLAPVTLAAGVAVLFTRFRFLTVALVFALAPISPFLHLDQVRAGSGLEFRLVLHVAPFLFLLLLWPAAAALRFAALRAPAGSPLRVVAPALLVDPPAREADPGST